MLFDSIRTWGGGEKWCVETATALRARGHAVAIACARGSALLERARDRNLETFVLARPPFGALLLARYLARAPFELVVANVGRDVRLGAAACALSGARLLQRRGIARPLKRDPLHRFLYRRSVRRIVANCEAIRARLLEGALFLDPARVVVVPNAVELPGPEAVPEIARVRAELGIEASAPLVGAVGRLSPMKGLRHLVEAWASMRADASADSAAGRAHLLLVGEGELAAELRTDVAARGLPASVHLTGFRRDAAAILAGLDLLVVPSVRDEGASNTLLEAMAHGRPAIVTRCGGLPETVGEGVGGLVVPPGDAEALAAALTRLLSRPEERLTLGRCARERARERHAPDVVAARWEELLAEVAAEDRPGA